jgi:hypothetical protein
LRLAERTKDAAMTVTALRQIEVALETLRTGGHAQFSAGRGCRRSRQSSGDTLIFVSNSVDDPASWEWEDDFRCYRWSKDVLSCFSSGGDIRKYLALHPVKIRAGGSFTSIDGKEAA